MKSDLSRKAEDYLEAVYVISQEKGHVRIRDICKELGTKPPSVVEMVKKLNDRGYLIYKKNEGLYLTAEGEEIGRIIKDRHDTIFAFLKFIGVPEQVADEDAKVVQIALHAGRFRMQRERLLAAARHRVELARDHRHHVGERDHRTVVAQW